MLTTHTQLPEAVIVKRLQAGDEEAFNLLFQQYHDAMVRLATVIVSEVAIAEDVVQETWLTVFKVIRSFEGRSSIKTWLFRIVINYACTYLKREQRHINKSELSLDAKDAGLAERITSQGNTYPETIADAHEFQEIVSQTIDLLPPNQQLIVRMRHLDGFSADEVSQQLGITDVNQRVLLHRARKEMRTKLRDYHASGLSTYAAP